LWRETYPLGDFCGATFRKRRAERADVLGQRLPYDGRYEAFDRVILSLDRRRDVGAHPLPGNPPDRQNHERDFCSARGEGVTPSTTRPDRIRFRCARRVVTVKICGEDIRIQGKVVRIAQLDADTYEFLNDPASAIDAMRECGARIDLFTFMQRVADTSPQ